MKEILNTEYALVEYYSEEKLVQTTWKKVNVLTIEEYQYAITKALDFQEEHKDLVQFYMSDMRLQGILSPAYRKWFQEKAIPRAIKNGMHAAAVIFKGNVFQKYYLNTILNTTKKYGVPLKFFGEREEALNWFKTL